MYAYRKIYVMESPTLTNTGEEVLPQDSTEGMDFSLDLPRSQLPEMDSIDNLNILIKKSKNLAISNNRMHFNVQVIQNNIYIDK